VINQERFEYIYEDLEGSILYPHGELSEKVHAWTAETLARIPKDDCDTLRWDRNVQIVVAGKQSSAHSFLCMPSYVMRRMRVCYSEDES
jgi:hypothetical protein